MIENVLILDTETTGLHPEKGDTVIEIGAILYNLKNKTILQNFSTLFPCEANPVEHINGISADSTKCNYPLEVVMQQLKLMTLHSQACIAHNAEFDKKFIKSLSVWQFMSHHPWICTRDHFKWPVNLYRNRLQDVCNAMGVPYVEAHRALNDCRLIAECFSKIGDLELRMETALLSATRTTGFAAAGNQYV